MKLKEIYQPIKRELTNVEDLLRTSLTSTGYKSIFEIGEYLLNSGGKRIRPALVILSAKASAKHGLKKSSGKRRSGLSSKLTKVASAIELIHTASLIHDDVVDHSELRHNKPSINAKWGQDVSIALGDYLYSVGFDLIASCGDTDILSCISWATKSMCEGELVQVCKRDSIDLLKEKYILIIKKKTANLFAASCQTGAIASQSSWEIEKALKNYGLNFGIAFQIIDDCMDLIGYRGDLGKDPGTDLNMGEETLPVLNLLAESAPKERKSLVELLRSPDSKEALKEVRTRFLGSPSYIKTQKDIAGYIIKAKRSLIRLEESSFKDSLWGLADFILAKIG